MVKKIKKAKIKHRNEKKIKGKLIKTKAIAKTTASKQPASKPRVGIHSITGCAGCQLSIYFIEDVLLDLLDKINLVAAPMIKEQNEEEVYDVLFVEGSVSSQEDLDNLLKWREKSKILVALGACACHGGVQSMKHLLNDKEAKEAEQYVYSKFPSDERVKPVTSVPIHKHVKVDFYIPGCPPDKQEIIQVLKHLLQGRRLKVYDKAVCHECALKENYCLLDQGIECLGPLMNGGCRALCPSYNHPCTGCRGLLDDANLESGKQILKDKGFDAELMIKRMTKYNALQYKEFDERLKPKPAECSK